MEREYSVYCLFNNKTNEIFYVGSTIRPINVRFREHCKPSRDEVGAIKVRELGKENVSICLVESCDCYDDMLDREYFWTAYYNEFFELVDKKLNFSLGSSLGV